MNACLKRVSLLIVLVVSFSLTACGGQDPKQSVTSFFDAIKKADVTTATQYLKDGKNALNLDDSTEDKMFTQLLSKIDYEIVSSTVNGKEAVVKVKVTTPDMMKITGEVMEEVLPQIFAAALNGGSEDDTEKIFFEAYSTRLSAEDVTMVTTDVDINLIKDSGNKKWLIEGNDDLANAITGNMSKALEDIGKSMSME